MKKDVPSPFEGYEAELTPNDISVDEGGRIVIRDKDFIRYINDLKAAGRLGPNIRIMAFCEGCGCCCP